MEATFPDWRAIYIGTEDRVCKKAVKLLLPVKAFDPRFLDSGIYITIATDCIHFNWYTFSSYCNFFTGVQSLILQEGTHLSKDITGREIAATVKDRTQIRVSLQDATLELFTWKPISIPLKPVYITHMPVLNPGQGGSGAVLGFQLSLTIWSLLGCLHLSYDKSAWLGNIIEPRTLADFFSESDTKQQLELAAERQSVRLAAKTPPSPKGRHDALLLAARQYNQQLRSDNVNTSPSRPLSAPAANTQGTPSPLIPSSKPSSSLPPRTWSSPQLSVGSAGDDFTFSNPNSPLSPSANEPDLPFFETHDSPLDMNPSAEVSSDLQRGKSLACYCYHFKSVTYFHSWCCICRRSRVWCYTCKR